MSLSAYQYEISLSITIYTIWYGQQQTAQCKFSLRNLQGDTHEKQVEHAKQILTQVIEELYYLTGFGIDKGIIKVGSSKVYEAIYPDLTPRQKNTKFEALLFQFNPPYRYEWVKDNSKKIDIISIRKGQKDGVG
jgi:hypothetical protein